MNIRTGGQFFANVKIPILWGSRAILQDQYGHLSIVNLEADGPVLEVIDDHPVAGTNFSHRSEDFLILDVEGIELYALNRLTKSVTSISLGLPTVTLGLQEVRVGTNVFVGSTAADIGVGVIVTESGVTLGGSLPPGLAALRV